MYIITYFPGTDISGLLSPDGIVFSRAGFVQ